MPCRHLHACNPFGPCACDDHKAKIIRLAVVSDICIYCRTPFGAEYMATMKERAARYRFRAEELRSLAEDWADSRAQAVILEMAMDYERMAETVGKLRVISSDQPAV